MILLDVTNTNNIGVISVISLVIISFLGFCFKVLILNSNGIVKAQDSTNVILRHIEDKLNEYALISARHDERIRVLEEMQAQHAEKLTMHESFFNKFFRNLPMDNWK